MRIQPQFFALGAGVRYKISPHISIVSEYYHSFNSLESVPSFDPFAFGVNWELGDVMLQFMLTNSFFMVEDSFYFKDKGRVQV